MTNFFPRLSQNCGVQEGLKNAFDLHSATRHNFVNATNTLHHSGESKRSTYVPYLPNRTGRYKIPTPRVQILPTG